MLGLSQASAQIGNAYIVDAVIVPDCPVRCETSLAIANALLKRTSGFYTKGGTTLTVRSIEVIIECPAVGLLVKLPLHVIVHVFRGCAHFDTRLLGHLRAALTT